MRWDGSSARFQADYVGNSNAAVAGFAPPVSTSAVKLGASVSVKSEDPS